MAKHRIIKPRHGTEYDIQEELREFLEVRGWLVERFIGNALQKGIPDLYAFHPVWEERWIDVKTPGKYSFTKAQRIKWPYWETFKCGVYILTAANEEEYAKLFGPPNMRDYWKDSWDKKYDFDQLFEDMKSEAANQTGTLALRPSVVRNGGRRRHNLTAVPHRA